MEIRKLMEEMKDVLFILLVTAFFTWIANCIQLPKVNMAEKLDWRTASRRDHGLRHSGFAPAAGFRNLPMVFWVSIIAAGRLAARHSRAATGSSTIRSR